MRLVGVLGRSQRGTTTPLARCSQKDSADPAVVCIHSWKERSPFSVLAWTKGRHLVSATALPRPPSSTTEGEERKKVVLRGTWYLVRHSESRPADAE